MKESRKNVVPKKRRRAATGQDDPVTAIRLRPNCVKMWTHGQQGKSMNRDAPRQSAVLSRWGLRALDGLKCVVKEPRQHRKWQARKLIGSVTRQRPTKNDKSASEGFSRAQRVSPNSQSSKRERLTIAVRPRPQINERTSKGRLCLRGRTEMPSSHRERDLWLANPSSLGENSPELVARETLTAGSAMSFRRRSMTIQAPVKLPCPIRSGVALQSPPNRRILPAQLAE
jgi:hypothetical protein